MASVQKIALSASFDIHFNKLMLSQSHVRRAMARRRWPPGTAPSSPDGAGPWEKRAAGDRLTPVGLRPPFVSRSPALSHPDCRSVLTLIVACTARLFTFHIIAVSGEITLHADHIYVQASQPATGHDTGIMYRTCQGRTDYYGGANNFASLDFLNRPDELAHRIKAVCHV